MENIVLDAMTLFSKRRNSCPPPGFGYGQDWHSLLAQRGDFLRHTSRQRSKFFCLLEKKIPVLFIEPCHEKTCLGF